MDRIERIAELALMWEMNRLDGRMEHTAAILANQINQLYEPQPDRSRLLTEIEVGALDAGYLDEADREPGGTGDSCYEDYEPLLKAQRDLTASIKDAEIKQVYEECGQEIKDMDKIHTARREALIEEIESNHKLGNAKWINGRDWEALKAKYLKATHCKGEEG